MPQRDVKRHGAHAVSQHFPFAVEITQSSSLLLVRDHLIGSHSEPVVDTSTAFSLVQDILVELNHGDTFLLTAVFHGSLAQS